MLVSVVIAVYNGEKYINQSIESILKQTYTDIELIIVNDGSTDRTESIIEYYLGPRVKLINLKENMGVSNARNIGIEAANGNWIAVQDADDISDKMRIRKQIKHIQRNPDCIAVASHIKCFSDFNDMDPSYAWGIENFHNSIRSSDELYNLRFKSCPISHGSTIFSKEVFKKIGGYSDKYKLLHDYDLWLRMFDVGRIDIVNTVLYYYRVHSSSITQKKWKLTVDEMMVISTKHFQEMLERMLTRKPNFLVFGSIHACHNFQEEVAKKNGMLINNYITDSNASILEECIQLYNFNMVDAFIVLEGPDSENTLQYLQNKGFIYNSNVISLYNVMN